MKLSPFRSKTAQAALGNQKKPENSGKATKKCFYIAKMNKIRSSLEITSSKPFWMVTFLVMPRYELIFFQRPEMCKGEYRFTANWPKQNRTPWIPTLRMNLLTTCEFLCIQLKLRRWSRGCVQQFAQEIKPGLWKQRCRTFKSFPKERWQKWTNSSSNGRFIWRNCVILAWKSSNLDFQFEWNKRVIGKCEWLNSFKTSLMWCSHTELLHLPCHSAWIFNIWVSWDGCRLFPLTCANILIIKYVFVIQEISCSYMALWVHALVFLCKSENWGAKESTGFLSKLF